MGPTCCSSTLEELYVVWYPCPITRVCVFCVMHADVVNCASLVQTGRSDQMNTKLHRILTVNFISFHWQVVVHIFFQRKNICSYLFEGQELHHTLGGCKQVNWHTKQSSDQYELYKLCITLTLSTVYICIYVHSICNVYISNSMHVFYESQIHERLQVLWSPVSKHITFVGKVDLD